jgi:hypothetical protein
LSVMPATDAHSPCVLTRRLEMMRFFGKMAVTVCALALVASQVKR